jgi:hypothetical protein
MKFVCKFLPQYIANLIYRQTIAWSISGIITRVYFRQITNVILLFTMNDKNLQGPSWPSSYGSWIYNYLCIQCLSPLMLWVWISIRAWCTTLCDKVCQWLVTYQWFSPGPPVSSTNKTDCHEITEISLKVALNITQKQTKTYVCQHHHPISLLG